MRNFFIVLLLIITPLISACGTLFYPERRGNNSEIDPTVAILDGIGLLFFIVPGVIAYGVDFTTGAIYLSPAKASGFTENAPLLDEELN